MRALQISWVAPNLIVACVDHRPAYSTVPPAPSAVSLGHGYLLFQSTQKAVLSPGFERCPSASSRQKQYIGFMLLPNHAGVSALLKRNPMHYAIARGNPPYSLGLAGVCPHGLRA